MKNVIVSDIHANYPALQSVVNREGRESTYFITGDVLGLNGFPSETVQMLQKLDTHMVLGNHDHALLRMKEGHVHNDCLAEYELSHTIESLSDQQVEWLLEHSYMKTFTVDGNDICITHAYPFYERAIGYEKGNSGVHKRDVIEVAARVSNKYDYVFHGHTHQQYSIDVSKYGHHDVIFTNAGSLGYNNHYAVYKNGKIDLKSVNYDESRVKNRIKSRLPEDCPQVTEWW